MGRRTRPSAGGAAAIRAATCKTRRLLPRPPRPESNPRRPTGSQPGINHSRAGQPPACVHRSPSTASNGSGTAGTASGASDHPPARSSRPRTATIAPRTPNGSCESTFPTVIDASASAAIARSRGAAARHADVSRSLSAPATRLRTGVAASGPTASRSASGSALIASIRQLSSASSLPSACSRPAPATAAPRRAISSRSVACSANVVSSIV